MYQIFFFDHRKLLLGFHEFINRRFLVRSIFDFFHKGCKIRIWDDTTDFLPGFICNELVNRGNVNAGNFRKAAGVDFAVSKTGRRPG